MNQIKSAYFFFNLQAMSVLGQEQFSAAIPQRAPVRWKHHQQVALFLEIFCFHGKKYSNIFLKIYLYLIFQTNYGVNFVPQQEAWVVERMGKFNKILEPGLNFLIPGIDKIKYVQSLKEIAIDIPSQSAITIGK